MNSALQLTGQSTPTGRIPFLQYTPPDTSKRQPLIIFLHGQGEGSNTHTTTTVRSLEVNGHGIFTLTASADLPTFTDPIRNTTHQFYMLGPQLYYSVNNCTTCLWNDNYITQMINYAKNNLNIDFSRIYLTGLSLGGGGTVVACMNNSINKQLAAAVSICPGYGNGSNLSHANIARSGVPLWIAHADNDTVTNPCTPSNPCTGGAQHGGELTGEQIIRKINAQVPLVPPRFFKYTTGGHVIWYRLYDITEGDTYPMTNGFDAEHTPGFFQWLLMHKRLDNTAPYYPPK